MKDYASKLTELKGELDEYKAKRKEIISTGQSWELRNGDDRRSLNNVSLAQLNDLIADLERQIAALEDIVTYGVNPKGMRVRAKVL